MKLGRRQLILGTLFGGAGYLGLRALATGLPAHFLRNPRRALAQLPPGQTCLRGGAQYLILSTSAAGDPINTSSPGTYEDKAIVHSGDPALAPKPLRIGDRTFTAGAPWSTLPQKVLDRTVFWHLMTDTPVHSREPDVLKLMGAAPAKEMFPSLLAKQLAPCLGTVQSQPITVGALTPSENLSYGGAALPVIPPLALRATLANPEGPLSALQALRTSTLDELYGIYKDEATPAQRRYMDTLLTSQQQVRNIRQDLLDALGQISDNSPAAQVKAAVTLIQMNVSPVVSIHIPFGGDNHRDLHLATETAETLSGVATIVALMEALAAAKLEDRVTFATLNVFGRTLGPGNDHGRSHNSNHQVSLTIGRPFRGGVVGGVTRVDPDYGALSIDAATGAGRPDGEIRAIDTLAAFAQSTLAAVGGDPRVITSSGGTAKIVTSVMA